MQQAERQDALLDIGLIADQAARLAPRPDLVRDREQAIRDLRTSAHFAPVGLTGPFRLRLGIAAGRLVFEVRDRDGTSRLYGLSLGPFRRLIKDYLMIVESYEEASRAGGPARLQAIDLGRRGIHDEAATLLQERLAGKIDIDHDTARRLFTLVSVLLQRP